MSIDQDVMERAQTAARDCYNMTPSEAKARGHYGLYEAFVASIARAIQSAKDSERERCAAKADSWATDVRNGNEARITAGKIAAAIRLPINEDVGSGD